MGISLSGLTESSTGNLTLSASSGNDVLIGNGSTLVYIDGGSDHVGVGSAASANSHVLFDFDAETATANTIYHRYSFAASAALTVPSGTTAIVSTVSIGEPNITATGTVTASASLYISGAASEATTDYALWVDDGAVRFDDRTFTIGGIAYEFPANNGNANEFLLTDGGGNLSWSSVASASASTTVTVTDNEATNENNLIAFVANAATATGNHGLEMDGDFHYSPNSGTVTATNFSGNLTGTLQTAAQGNITSVGTLTDLTVSGTSTTIGTVTSGVWNAGAVTSSGAITGASLVADNTTINNNVISTSSGNLTLSSASGSDVLIGDNATILFVDGGTSSVMIGASALVSANATLGISHSKTYNTTNTVAHQTYQGTITQQSTGRFGAIDVQTALTHTTGGTVPLAFGLRVLAPTLTVSAGAVTESATLYVSGAMSNAGSNYAIHVAAGVTKLDGGINVTGNSYWNNADMYDVGNAASEWTSGALLVHSAAANSHAKIELNEIGGGAGDAIIRFQETGTSKFTVGLDDTDSTFRLSASGDLGTNDLIKATVNQINFYTGGGNSAMYIDSSRNLYMENHNIYDVGAPGMQMISGEMRVGGDAGKFVAPYTDNATLYAGTFGWNHLLLGNNAINYLIAGHNLTGGDFYFVVNNTSTITTNGSGHNGTVAMAIDSAGKVGIGTTAPSSNLEVAASNAASTLTLSSWDVDTIGNVGTLKFTKSASNTIQTFAATGDGEWLGTIGFYGSDSGSTISARSSFIDVVQSGSAGGSSVASYMSIGTSGTERMNITSAGNLDFNAGDANYRVILRQAYASLVYGGLVINESGGSSSEHNLRVESDTNTSMLTVVASTNRVGIGIAAPNNELHLHDPGGGNVRFQMTNATSGSGTGDGLRIQQDALNTIINNQESGTMDLQTAGTSRVTISATGLVGIGLTNPDTYLHVIGDGSSRDLFRVQMSGGSGNFWDLTCDNSGSYMGWDDYLYMRPDNSTAKSVQITATGVTLMMNTYQSAINSSPQLILDRAAVGSNNSWTSIKFRNSSTYSNENWYIGSYGHASDNEIRQFRIANHDATSVFMVNHNGNVGIGTTAPGVTIGGNSFGDPANRLTFHVRHNTSGQSANIHIDGQSYAQLTLSSQSSSANQKTLGIYTQSQKSYFNLYDTNGSTAQRFLTFDHSNGYVGIGRASPGNLLEAYAASTARIRVISGAADALLWIDAANDRQAYIQMGHNGNAKWAWTSNYVPSANADHLSLYNYPNNLNTLIVTPDGNWGWNTGNGLPQTQNGDLGSFYEFRSSTSSKNNVLVLGYYGGSDSQWNIIESRNYSSPHTEKRMAQIAIGNAAGGEQDRGSLSVAVWKDNSADYDAFVINHDADVTGTHGSYHTSSDERLKENVVTISNALAKVAALRGVNFTWRDRKKITSAQDAAETTYAADTDLKMGLIAQEVEAVIPEVVHTQLTDDGIKAVEYQYIVGLLVEAIKELKTTVDGLTA